MRSVSNRIALYGIASAAILTTFSHTRAAGEPMASSFSPVSDDSLNISSCDESSVARQDPFEILSRLCAVDLAYSVGSLSTTRSDASTSSRAEYIVENSEVSSIIEEEYNFDATIRWRNNKREEDKSFQVTYVFAYGQGIADGRVDNRAVLINPGGANGMPARAVNKMLFRGVAGDGGTYEFGFLGSGLFEEDVMSNNNFTKRADNLVAIAYNGQWCERVSSGVSTCAETSYAWCCGPFLSSPPPPQILISPIGGNGNNSYSDDGNITSMSGPLGAFDMFEHSSPSVFDVSFHNSKNVPLTPLAQALDRGARMPKSSKLPSNIGTFGSIAGLICVSLVLIAIVMEISRRCIKRVAKDLESCAPEISRKLTHLLPGQTNVSLDVDLEGIIVSKARNHHHANANEATSEHTLRRPQSRHVSIFENDGTRTLEFECVVASSQNKLDSQEHEDGRREKGSSSELRGLKYASQTFEAHGSVSGYVQSLARMFDSDLFTKQRWDGDGTTGEPSPKEKKGWRARALRKNEFKIALADVKVGHAIGRGAYGVVCEGTFRGFPVAVKTLNACKSTLSRKEKSAFEREISLLSRLSHANIVAFYGACTDDKDNQLCVVMELMTKSLFQVLHENDGENKKSRRLTRLEFLRVASDVAAGCAYLHELKITHGDLKSHNVLLNGSSAKICDVGCARVAQITGMVTTQQSITVLHSNTAKGATDAKENNNNNNNNKNVVGTPAYMAPELFDRSLDITFGIDVFALAVLFWECLSGEPPWSHVQHPVQIAFAVCNDERCDVEKVGDWEEAKLLIKKCWKRVPGDRLRMHEIVELLRDMRTKVR